MKVIYDKFKDKLVTFQNGDSGWVCGYTETNLLLAMTTKPSYSFRQFSKGFHFVDEKYKGKEYRYCFCGESDAEK